MAKIAELVVNLKASTASFATDLAKANRLSFDSSKQICASLSRISTVFAGVAASAAAAGVAMIGTSIQQADKFNKLSQTAGISVEALSALSYAAKLSDVSLEDLSGGVSKLSKGMYLAATGSKEQAKAFDTLKISVKDAVSGQLRPAEDVLLDLADRFSKMEDGTTKSALAAAALGKAIGPQMIPFLNQGREGIRAAMEEARGFGLVLSKETTQAAEDFSDNVTRLQSVLAGMGNTMMVEVLPFLNQFSAALVDGAAKGEGYKTTMASLVTLLRLVGTGLLVVGSDLEYVGIAVGSAFAGWGQLFEGNLKGAMEAAAEGHKAMLEVQDFVGKTLVALWDDAGREIQGKAPEIGKRFGAPIIEAAKAAKVATDELDAKIGSTILGLMKEADTLGMTAGQLKLYEMAAMGADAAQLALAGSLLQEIEGHQEQKEVLDSAGKLVQEYEQSLNSAAQTQIELAQTGEEKFEVLRLKLGELLEAGEITQKVFDWRMLQISSEELAGHIEEMGSALRDANDVARDLGRELETAFSDAIIYGKGWGEVLDTLLRKIEEMILRTYVFGAISEALAGAGGFLGVMGSFFGGLSGKQAGGAVTPGAAYVVGERGPEVFVPAMAGQIVPHGAGGAGTVNYYTIDARGADISVERRLLRVLRMFEARAVGRSLAAVRESGLRTA